MVLSVCRRMLSGSADVEDAFQAVFFVLARKASALQRVEELKSWLYGVAVRTAKEARRRSTRLRRREGGVMDETRAVAPSNEGRGDLLDLLDEEIDRLPRRYREAVLLCELEGTSRQVAARRLGLSEGTLSSRLARGRILLRDRLSKRGVTLAAGAITVLSEPANATLPEPLAHSTVQFALKFAAGGATSGTIPAAVSSLAEGVLAMMSAARLKTILISVVSLGGAACLTAGISWAALVLQGRQPDEGNVPAPVAQSSKAEPVKENPLQEAMVRGIVVDEAGRPVTGVEVRVDPFRVGEARGITKADGTFAITISKRQVDGTALLARSAEGDRLGIFQYDWNLSDAAARIAARIVLKPGREVQVHVTSADKDPVRDAAVEVAGSYAVFDDARTGPDGSAKLRIPTDAKVEWIFALKSGLGFDYADYGQIDDQRRSQGGALATSLPGSVNLTLDGVRTARIKAVDSAGKPLAGTGFYVWLIHKEGRRSEVNVASRLLGATTGRDGIVTFDWLPPSQDLLQFWPVDQTYANRRVTVAAGQTGPVTARLVRKEAIRGRVLRTDGTPAPGVEVTAYGSGKGIENGYDRTRTASDGTYELRISPGEAYAVSVEDKDWAAPSRLDVIVRQGKPVDGVNFQITAGTMLRGTVTVGPTNRPAPNQYIRLDENGGRAPEEFREKGDTIAHEVRRQFGAMTDSAGHYSIRVGPGTYTLMGPPRTPNEKITINEEKELVRDFRMPRPEKGTLTGWVKVAGAGVTGVAGAKVEIVAVNMMGISFAVTADAKGHFRADRDLDPLVICARSPDGRLGAVVEVGAEDPQVVISLSPTATATGVLLDEKGKPAANQDLFWGRRVYLDEEQKISTECFAPKVKTDGEGKFTLPSLVVGQRYEIAVQRENVYPAAGMVRPDKAVSIDLGTLRVGAYHEKTVAGEMSSFRKNAPGPGAIAAEIEATTLDGKPLKLSDYKGQYVLLDFWATWCGPCIGEIPQLQAVHDAFGSDERFTILSLSVDEKVEAARKFQEKRNLPWPQAFVGGGIHGSIPGKFGVEAIPAFVLIDPDGKIVDRGMRGDEIKKAVAKVLARASAP